MRPEKTPPKSLGSLPLGCSLLIFLGGPIVMLLTFGGMFYAKGKGVLAPDPDTGQIYEVCIGRACRPHYVTHAQYVVFQITQIPAEILTVGALAILALVSVFFLWKKFSPT
jgi:hypothetical protein